MNIMLVDFHFRIQQSRQFAARTTNRHLAALKEWIGIQWIVNNWNFIHNYSKHFSAKEAYQLH